MECGIAYNDIMEKLEQERKEEKHINNLLAKLPEQPYPEVDAMENVINKEQEQSKLDENVLNLSQVSLSLRLSQNFQAHLHSLNVVFVGRHSGNFSLLGLMLF